MKAHRWVLSSLAFMVVLGWCGMVLGQESKNYLPFEPSHRGGASVTGAYEGWFPNDDGTFSALVGYYNRNLREAVDIPVGPDNNIEPGGPDLGQPTHFYPGRQWGLLVVKLPKDFGNKALTWTLTADGITTKIPLDLRVLYRVAPYVDANDNHPPYVGFSEEGPFLHGPSFTNADKTLTATVGTPLPLNVWAADAAAENALPGTPVSTRSFNGQSKPKEPVTLLWGEYRGPADVKFSDAEPLVSPIDTKLPSTDNDKFDGKASNTVTFSAPGQYVLFVQASNDTGSGGAHGFQCCWTTAKVTVTVAPSTGNAE